VTRENDSANNRVAVKEEKELKTKVKKNIVLLKKTQFEKKRA